ncbi:MULTISPECIES: amino acid ABC transporter permease [Cysteiniphilum]|uniref:amino acid ABC transporter permease n=1 Tax=Cysteiniphilum TaxID=2056696 RepID=UPI00193A6753|nr:MULTISPECIES: ABC transporter permease subunit [Cysteiniphilum]
MNNLLHIVVLLCYGLYYTIIVTLSCSLTGLAFGLLMTFIYTFKYRVFAACCNVVSYILRSIPVLVMIFLVYFSLPELGIMNISAMLSINLSLGLIAGAYLFEVFKGALLSIDKTELIAATAQGFKPWQIFLFIKLPQILRFSFSGMINEFTSVLKYSPFAYVIGVPEMMKQAMSLTLTHDESITIYCILGLMYFLIYKCFLILIHKLYSKVNTMKIHYL